MAECVFFQRPDRGQICFQPVRQRIGADDFSELAVFLVSIRCGARIQRCEPFRLCPFEGPKQRPRNPRMGGQDAVLYHDGAVHGVDAGPLEPFGLERVGMFKKVRIDRRRNLVLVPACDRGTGASNAGIGVKSGNKFAVRHHGCERPPRRCMGDVWRQSELRDVLFVVDHPGHLGAIEPKLIFQNPPRPDARGNGPGTDADFFSLKVLRAANKQSRLHEKP